LYRQIAYNKTIIQVPTVRYLIISRYVIKEVILATIAVLLVLLLISLSNAFVGYLADAAQGLLSLRLVLYVLILNIPFLASFLLPLSFFFGIVLGLGRLYADSEMTALRACGYGRIELLKTLLIPIGLVMLLTGILNFYWAPHYMHQLTKVLAQAEQDLLARMIIPGRFQTTPDGRYVIYIEDFDPDTQQAEGVFIAEQKSITEGVNVITSQKAKLWTDPSTDSDYIVLNKGERYSGRPGQTNYQQIGFDEYGVRVMQKEPEYSMRERVQSTESLLANNTPKSQAELQWRLSLTLSVLVMAILALLLAELKPRQGKYANALPAILVIILYTNFLILAKGWVEDGKVSSALGMYWVVALGLILGSAWFLQRTRLWHKKSQ
jgi:lipopolysaccharide export system permease protein